jgi:Spy/CpxP family protein refolding chaperone
MVMRIVLRSLLLAAACATAPATFVHGAPPDDPAPTEPVDPPPAEAGEPGAGALESASPPQEAEPPLAEGDAAAGLLAGPKVEDGAQKGDAARRAEGMGGRRDAARIPLRRWIGVLRDLRLSTEQMAQVRAILDEMERSQREFRAAHGAEMSELRRKITDAERDGEAARARELQRRMREVQRAAPRPEAFQERIFAILTPAQQDLMRAQLALLEAAPEPGAADARAPLVERLLDRAGVRDDVARRRIRFLLSRDGRDGGR